MQHKRRVQSHQWCLLVTSVCVIHSNAELHTASQCTIPCSESVSRSNH